MSETPRVFINKKNIDLTANFATLVDKEEIHYLKNVQRCKAGSSVIALDNQHNCFYGLIDSITNDEVLIQITRTEVIPAFPSFHITLVQGLVKGEKQDFIIQKATELGVSKIITTCTDYTDVKLSDNSLIEKKLQRWHKIARQSTKQSKRASIPDIFFENNLHDAITSCQQIMPDMPIIVCSEKTDALSFKKVINNIVSAVSNIVLVIGPEGGWSDKELKLFSKINVYQASLGKNVLRVETAIILAIGYLIYELELT